MRLENELSDALGVKVDLVERRARGHVDPEATSFDTWLDAVHEDLEVPADEVELGPAMVQGRLL